MALFELSKDGISRIATTTFGAQRVAERGDLQRILRDHIDVIAPDTMVLVEEFGEWDDSRRRIDLLCLDKNANLVVVELKRTEDGGHVELQAIRYAAMVSTMTFAQAVEAHADYRAKRSIEGDAAADILSFLDWEEANDEQFAADVSIVLVAADFSKEVTTSVLWLNERDLDIRCVRLRPYRIADRLILDVEQVIPLPEAKEFQIGVREKARAERQARKTSRDASRYDITVGGVSFERQWKRHAILHIAQALCRSGVAPEEIAATTEIDPQRLWFDVDGIVGSDAFIAAASAIGASGSRRFDARRWATNDDQLIHHNGRTYALSDQWGTQTLPAIEALAKRYPKVGIRCAKSESGL